MTKKITLSDARDLYIQQRRAKRKALATVRNNDYVLRRFLTVTGNLYVHNIREHHIDEHFVEASKTRGDESLGVDHSTLNGFFKWAVRNGYMVRSQNPMEEREAPRFTPRPWRGVHLSKFPALLDAAQYPRDRMLIALGLYGLGRATELTAIRIRNVDLDAARIAVIRSKVHDSDRIPISSELDEELRLWLKLYTEEVGVLRPDYFLLPTKTRPRLVTQPGGLGIADRSTVRLVPERKIHEPHNVVKAALEAIGFPTRDEFGNSLNEGMHTLRRSGARALYDTYVELGYPDALRRVQVILGHKSVTQTEHYIGIYPDRVVRDETIAGKVMFPSLRTATPLRRIDGGQGLQSEGL